MVTEKDWLELKEKEKYGIIVNLMKRIEKLENSKIEKINFKKQFPSLIGLDDGHIPEMDQDYIKFLLNKHCLDKQRVKQAIIHVTKTREPRIGDLSGECESQEFKRKLLKELEL